MESQANNIDLAQAMELTGRFLDKARVLANSSVVEGNTINQVTILVNIKKAQEMFGVIADALQQGKQALNGAQQGFESPLSSTADPA